MPQTPPPSTARVAVVILNWNGADMLRRFLPLVVAHSGDVAETIVADNGSSDNSRKILEEDFPAVRRIYLDRNYGFAEGYNRALNELPHEFYLLLNSDVETSPNWIRPLLYYMDAHPEVAACQPKLRSYFQRNSFEYAGAAGGFMDRWGYPYCRGRVLSSVEEDNGQYDEPCPIFWATGAALLVRRSDWQAADGLDGRFFAHQEEIDLCWRFHLCGRGVACVPQSVVYHLGGATLPKANPRKTFLNFRNNLLMLYKNVPEEQLASLLRLRRCLDLLAALHFFLTGKWGSAFAVIRARQAFRKMRPQLQSDREAIQKQAACDAPLTPLSLLWQYYFRRKRTFAALHADFPSSSKLSEKR